MTDSVNGRNEDKTPDEVHESEPDTLDAEVKAALDALEAKLDRMAAGTEGVDVADAPADADEGDGSDDEIDEDAEVDDEVDDEEAVPAPKKVRWSWTRKRSHAPADADEGDESDEEIDEGAEADEEIDDGEEFEDQEFEDEEFEDEEFDEDEEGDDEEATPAPKKVRRMRKRSYAPAGRVEHNPWLFLGPLVGVLVILTVLPLARLIFDSLFERSLTAPDDARFSHVRNFIDVVDGRDWWLAVALTLVVVTVAVLAQLLLGAAFAGTLRRITFGGPWVQALLLAPFVLMPAAGATAWRDGWVDGFAVSWFRIEPGGGQLTALATLLSHEVWRGTGLTTVILLAGLSRVKPSLLDAAIADGATARQRITHVVLPAVAPAVAVVALYRSLDALRSIEAPILTADSLGDLSTASHLVWTTSFTDFEIGLGAAMALLLILLAAALGLLLTLLMQVRRAL